MVASQSQWLEWLEEARSEVHRACVRLGFRTDGPLAPALRLAPSFEWMEGPFADTVRDAVRVMTGVLGDTVEDLLRLKADLERAEDEARAAVTAVGGVPVAGPHPRPQVNHFASSGRVVCLPDLRAAHAAGPSGYVMVVPEQARLLARLLRDAAVEFDADWRRLQGPLTVVGVEPPLALSSLASAAGEVAGEIDRRVDALEAADAEAARRFQGAVYGEAYDPNDPVGSSLRRVLPMWPPPPAVGPGRQDRQVKEADPVSTSTGNYFLEVTDLAQPALGVPTVFRRAYNSLRAGTDGPLGFGWSHSWGVRLSADGAGATVTWGDGHQDRHRRAGNGWVAPPGVFDRLRADGDGFVLATRAKVDHHFAAAGQLVAMTDRSGNRTVFDYDDDGHLGRLTDGSGVVTAVECDRRGRVVAVAGVAGRRWSYRYDRAGDLVAVSDPEGGETGYEYDADHRLVVVVDPEGRLVVRNRYDDLGRVVEQTDGAGGRWRYDYQPNLTVVTDPLGATRAFRFDADYRTTAVSDANGSVTRFGWDAAANPISVTDPTGRVFSFEWDGRGNLTAASGPGTAPVTLAWDDEDRLLGLACGEQQATFEWDEASRPVRFTSAGGVATTVRWRGDGLPEAVVDGAGAADRFGYDDRGRLASGTDPLGATTAVVFDVAGRPVAETHPEGGETRFEWDRADRLVAVTDAGGGTTRYDYDRAGLLVAATDPLGRTTRYRYEARALLEAVTDPLDRETTFAYDPRGRLVGRRDARGEAVSLTYDPGGRLVRVEAPGAVPVGYQWDPAGRLVGMVDETGETTWELDEAGRPAVEHRPGGVDLTHGYDHLGRRRRLEVHRAGTLVGAWDYATDGDGRITVVTDHTGRRHELGYDPAGRPNRIRHPNGVTTTWTHDPAGQPVALEVTAGATDLAAWRAGYDGDGNRRFLERNGDGSDRAEATYGYDLLGRLISAGHGAPGNFEPSEVEGPGSADTPHPSRGDGTHHPTPAPDPELDPVPPMYRWDGAHNRTAASGLVAAFDAADQITSDGRHAYGHDAAGGLTTRTPLDGDAPDLACAYDALGRTTAITAGAETARFGYDGLGRRVLRHDDTGTTFRVFDDHHVVAEIHPDGRVDLETTAGLLVLARHGDAGNAYLHPGLNTDVAVVTDDTGAVTARYGYRPFGARTVVDGAPDAAGPLGFCGTLGVRADLGGLLDMRARFYDPATGRFTTPDPWPAHLPEPITLNRYLYALGDPVSQVDPYGLFCLTGKNDQGKCRGLKDVVQRTSEAVRGPADVISAVGTGVAAIAVGVTAVCPMPCGIVSVPVAGFARGAALGAGIVATAARCGEAWSFTSFDCMAGLAGQTIGFNVGRLVKVGHVLGRWSDETLRYAEFGAAIFGAFMQGTSTLADRMRK